MSDPSDPESEKEAVTRPGAPEPPSRGRAASRKQDHIAIQLRRVYDQALREAIPDDMLKLLDQLDGDAGKLK
jgi:Anti-sigma factor NepR